MRHATVTLYYDDHSEGVDRIRNAQNATTDDLGDYEMTSLRPGTYYLSATREAVVRRESSVGCQSGFE